MSSQAREKSALTNDVQICVIPLATSVALFLRVLCYFGCSTTAAVQIFRGSEMRVSGSEFWICGASTSTAKQKGAIARYR